MHYPIQALDLGLNAAVMHIAAKTTKGFKVSPNAPETYEALCADVRATGVITVWDGASDNTIFGDPEVNYAARAWHDWCHVTGGYDFSLMGERSAWRMQASHIFKLYGVNETTHRWVDALYVEVVLQREYFETSGQFPEDQMAFTLAHLSHIERVLYA